MKQLFSIIAVIGILLITSGCSDSYDDSLLSGRVDNLESRVTKLEELCKQMNTNVSSLQSIVTALQSNDYITNVTPITKDGVTIGYTISFAKSSPITIYHGKDGQDGNDGKNGIDGKDGSTPSIGVKQDTDGIYYWTLNGEWLTGADGAKIKAEGRDGQNGSDGKDGENGSDGKDGITPQLKIENGYWYISYNNGITWTELNKATGEDGQDGKDAVNMFQTITEEEYAICFVLSDGTELRVPKIGKLSIRFSTSNTIECYPSEIVTIEYTLNGGSPNTVIEAIAENYWTAEVEMTDAIQGKITVTAPSKRVNGKVIVLANNNDSGQSAMEVLTFNMHPIVVTTGEVINCKATSCSIKGNVTGVTSDVTVGIVINTTNSLSETSGTQFSTTSQSEYSVDITALRRGETYYYRAYAVVDKTYYFGEIKQFTTPSTYAIGDLYPDDSVPEGVVFDIDAQGVSGKIVSLDQSDLVWQPGIATFVDANNLTDGTYNKFPVGSPIQAWVSNHGTGWYCPAKNELHALCSSIKEVNQALRKIGSAIIEDFYWSSTQYSVQNYDLAYMVTITENDTYMGYKCGWSTYNSKSQKHGVLAIKKFQ